MVKCCLHVAYLLVVDGCCWSLLMVATIMMVYIDVIDSYQILRGNMCERDMCP